MCKQRNGLSADRPFHPPRQELNLYIHNKNNEPKIKIHCIGSKATNRVQKKRSWNFIEVHHNISIRLPKAFRDMTPIQGSLVEDCFALITKLVNNSSITLFWASIYYVGMIANCVMGLVTT